jgi:hypothetical protein
MQTKKSRSLLVLPASHNGDKITEVINLKERKVGVDSQFQKVHSMVAWPCCFEPMAAQDITVGV